MASSQCTAGVPPALSIAAVSAARRPLACAAGWTPAVPFEAGLRETVAWYRGNEWWWRPIKEHDPAFRAYYQAQYERRP